MVDFGERIGRLITYSASGDYGDRQCGYLLCRTGTLTYQNNDITTNIPTVSGYYVPRESYKNVMITEASFAVVEYKDNEGLAYFKKVQFSTVAGNLAGLHAYIVFS